MTNPALDPLRYEVDQLDNYVTAQQGLITDLNGSVAGLNARLQDALVLAVPRCVLGTAGGVISDTNARRLYFQKTFPNVEAKTVAGEGKTIIGSFKAFNPDGSVMSYQDVANGKADVSIGANLAVFSQLPGQHFLGYHHEPEHESLTLGVKWSPAAYKAAWLRVRSLAPLRRNWRWLAVLTGYTFDVGTGTRDPSQWVPYDIEVVGTDPYNWVTANGSALWRDPEAILKASIAWAEARGLPLVVAETGCPNGDTAAQGQWVRDLGVFVKATPSIIGLSYYNKPHQTGAPDWTLAPDAEVAYHGLTQDPYFVKQS